MPYIKKKEREDVDLIINKLLKDIGKDRVIIKEGYKNPSEKNFTEGHLNYLITKLCIAFLESYGKSYSTINKLMGVLECAKQELYRRVVSPYEDKKIKENGDIY